MANWSFELQVDTFPRHRRYDHGCHETGGLGIILTDLGRSQTLLGQFKDLLFNIIGGEFQPLEAKRGRSEPKTNDGTSPALSELLTVGTLRLYGRADWDRPFLQHTVTQSHTVATIKQITSNIGVYQIC